jgi:hypothetical protein
VPKKTGYLANYKGLPARDSPFISRNVYPEVNE